ncbi:MAG: hypothetical protein ACHQM7_06465 [Vicinamibacterales bacterium]
MKQYGRRGLVCLTLFVGLATPPIGSAVGPGDAPFQVRVGHARDAFWVTRAVEGAARRLEHARCREVLSDFRGVHGRTLAEELSAEGVSGPGHLRRLFFYSGEGQRPCRKGLLAWTTPGSRVVYVCPARFREGHGTSPARLEAIVIHEMLHTLGLGEDPPSSGEITARVEAACNG